MCEKCFRLYALLLSLAVTSHASHQSVRMLAGSLTIFGHMPLASCTERPPPLTMTSATPAIAPEPRVSFTYNSQQGMTACECLHRVSVSLSFDTNSIRIVRF